MIKLELIGNLGADAQIQIYNGKKYVSFRVANTDSWTDKNTGEITQSTQWVSCSMNGDGGGITQYLKKGTKVFVRGNASFVVYSSPKTHQMEVGVNLYVREIELCGGKPQEQQPQEQQAQEQQAQEQQPQKQQAQEQQPQKPAKKERK